MTQVPDWYKDFVAAVVSGLPGDIDEATAMKWIRDPAGLESALADLASGSTISGALGHDRLEFLRPASTCVKYKMSKAPRRL